MSREKQIEEMAKIVAVQRGYGCTEQDHCDMSCQVCKVGCIPHEDAQILYGEGYRKQSDVIRCKDCEHFYQVGDVRICRHWNYHTTKDDAYCSYAKMKGGSE